MNKEGIVMEIQKDKVGILTSEYEFIYVNYSSFPPCLGSYYAGKLIKASFFHRVKRFLIIVIMLIFLIIFSLITYYYV